MVGTSKDSLWNVAKETFKIQQIREEWEWLIDKVIPQDLTPRGLDILEIGCYDGGSSYYLNQFARNMITIDNNNPCRFEKYLPKFRSNYRYVAGDSHHPDQTRLFGEYEWDFAFIDGDHSYEGVKADFYNLLPYLKKGTPVAFHDIAISDFHHQHGCYVGEFWEELKREYKATKFEEFSTNSEWAGIGICWV
jgi:predicted O-methyltransferase YrrM